MRQGEFNKVSRLPDTESGMANAVKALLEHGAEQQRQLEAAARAGDKAAKDMLGRQGAIVEMITSAGLEAASARFRHIAVQQYQLEVAAATGDKNAKAELERQSAAEALDRDYPMVTTEARIEAADRIHDLEEAIAAGDRNAKAELERLMFRRMLIATPTWGSVNNWIDNGIWQQCQLEQEAAAGDKSAKAELEEQRLVTETLSAFPKEIFKILSGLGTSPTAAGLENQADQPARTMKQTTSRNRFGAGYR